MYPVDGGDNLVQLETTTTWSLSLQCQHPLTPGTHEHGVQRIWIGVWCRCANHSNGFVLEG